MTLVLDYLKVIALVAGTVAAVAAAAKTTPIGRGLAWTYRRLVGDPLAKWFRAEVSDIVHNVVDERLMKPNGGKSLADLAARHDRLEPKVDAIARHLGIEE